MVEGLENMFSKEKLRELEKFSLGKRWLQGDLIAAFNTYKEVTYKEWSQIFSEANGRRMKDSGHKVNQGRF